MIESAPQQWPTDMVLPAAPEASPFGRRQQLLQVLLNNHELLLKNRLEVRHLMTRDPIVVAPTMTFDEIVAVMERQRLHHLLVGGLGGEVLGYISDRDLRNRRDATAQQLMRSPALSVAPETPLSPAITYLITENISCLAVVDRGRLCGMLTAADLALTLQCMLQLWLRVAQLLQQESTWTKKLDAIAAALEGNLTAAQLADRIAKARQAIQRQVREVVDAVDLRADVLTDMSGRRGLEEVLAMLLAVKNRFGQSFSVAVVAIDHFRHIRESCGDAVIRPLVKAVAHTIEQMARDCDFVARSRDEAFAVVMPQTSLEEAEAFCSRLRTAARKNRELNIELRISTGAVAPAPGEDAAQLVDRAEAAVN